MGYKILEAQSGKDFFLKKSKQAAKSHEWHYLNFILPKKQNKTNTPNKKGRKKQPLPYNNPIMPLTIFNVKFVVCPSSCEASQNLTGSYMGILEHDTLLMTLSALKQFQWSNSSSPLFFFNIIEKWTQVTAYIAELLMRQDEMQRTQAKDTQEIPTGHHPEDGLVKHWGRPPRESLCPWRYSNLDWIALSGQTRSLPKVPFNWVTLWF